MKALHFNTHVSLPRVGYGALVLALTVMALPQVANAEVIWGRQTGLGNFETEKVNLSAPKTVTSVTFRGTDHACIWAGLPRAEVVVCGDSAGLTGQTLPAEKGYFAIPKKPSANASVEVQITVE